MKAQMKNHHLLKVINESMEKYLRHKFYFLVFII